MPAEGCGSVLITGATAGLGQALARCFARDGHSLIAVGRDRDRLETMARAIRDDFGVKVDTLVADLAASGAVMNVISDVEASGTPVDVVVNNAGLGIYGPIAEAEPEEMHELIAVNVTVPVLLTRHLLPPMVARGRGTVINIASVAAFQPVPLMGVYAASKAFVYSFSEALADELRGTGVKVMTVCPGPFHSNFQQSAGMERSKNFRGRLPRAEQVAEEIYGAYLRGQSPFVPGWTNRLLALASRLAPSRLAAAVARCKVSEA